MSDIRRLRLLPRLSLRLRLALWVIALYLVVLLTLGLIVTLYERKGIRDAADARIETRMDFHAYTQGLNPSYRADQASNDPDREAVILTFNESGQVKGNAVTGEVRSLIERLGADIPPDATRRAAARSEEGGPLRVIVRRYGDGPAIVGVGRDEAATAAMAAVHSLVMLLGLAGLVAIAVAAWHAGGLAAAPLREVRLMAKRLNPEAIPDEIDLHGESEDVMRLQLELDRAMRRLEAGYNSQSRFISNVAHELKTPVAVILTESETMLRSGRLDEEGRRYAKSVIEELRRLGRLTESFLLLTRVKEGKAQVVDRTYPVNELVMDSVERCVAMAESYGVRLAPMLFADDPDASVSGDHELLQTAVDNLLRNAIRFSPKGSPVNITVDATDSELTITVRDHGPGIPEDVIEHVFDRFAQAEDEERRGRGSGLGLEIARGIAELHRGDVTVRNVEPGAAFTIRLPRNNHTNTQNGDPGTHTSSSDEKDFIADS